MAFALAFAARTVSAEEQAKSKEPVFVDTPPIALVNPPPTTGDCASPASAERSGKTAWQRGYEQAMSGARYELPLKSTSGTVQPAKRSCLEYSEAHLSEGEIACCKAGFGAGTPICRR